MQICSRLLLFFWAAVWCLSGRASMIPWLQASGALSPARSPYWRTCFLLTWGHSPSVPSGLTCGHAPSVPSGLTCGHSPHQSHARDQALPPPSGAGAAMSHYLLTLPADLCARHLPSSLLAHSCRSRGTRRSRCHLGSLLALGLSCGLWAVCPRSRRCRAT